MAEPSKILVTGAAGFIGSHTCELLLRHGCRVVGVDSLTDSYSPEVKLRNIETARSDPGFEFVREDFRNLDPLPEGVHAVVHLAALAGVRQSFTEADEYMEVNSRGSEWLATASARAGITRFVMGSSSSVYGDAPLPTPETAEFAPISPYAESKVEAERACAAVGEDTGMEVSRLRFFSVYGPRQRPDQVMHRFASRMLAGQSIEFFGDGSSTRDYTYVGDVAKAVLAAVGARGATGPFNVGAARSTSLVDLGGALAARFGTDPPVLRTEPARGDVTATLADNRLAGRVLGWRPEVSLDAGLSIFTDWYREIHGIT